MKRKRGARGKDRETFSLSVQLRLIQADWKTGLARDIYKQTDKRTDKQTDKRTDEQASI